MAEANLDDFFAKKDKSKKKSKVKSGEGDESLKSATKKDKKKDKDKTSSSNSSSNKNQERKVDDEWNDFEEEKAVDYSGLRIQTLQQKEDQEKDGECEEEELDEFGEVKERKDGVSGPWNKSSGSGTSAGPASIGKIEEEKPAPAPVVSSGKYIPPSQRAGAVNTPASSLQKARRKKEMPNLQSEFDFPTLAGQEPQPVTNNVVKRDSGAPGPRKVGTSLSLENKFSVLQD